MLLGDALEVGGDGGAVDIVAASLALGLEHVFLAVLRGAGELARGEPRGGGVVHGVDVGEGAVEGGGGGG